MKLTRKDSSTPGEPIVNRTTEGTHQKHLDQKLLKKKKKKQQGTDQPILEKLLCQE